MVDQNGYYQGPGNGTIYRIKSVAGAIAGMNEIIIQGEGVKTYHRDALNELAHYYEFQKVLESIQPGGDWSNYQNDVFPMAANPGSLLSQFPANALALNTTFNGLFSQLLDQLHVAFNSTTPDTGIQNAITTMLELQTPAQELMQIALSKGPGNCGPTFEYTAASSSAKA